MSVLFDNPVQPVLTLPADLAAWQRCASISDAAARWRVYLHELGAAALLSWFQAEFDVPVQLWPENAPWDIWQVVSGLALTLGDKRIVAILDETKWLSKINYILLSKFSEYLFNLPNKACPALICTHI
ncbi:MAG: DUF1822 family protein [Leptolyngbyaceae cyanobacterium]